jgi:TetR/AcrR family transcriptional regulator, cholesterol catabolism regulator
MPRATGRRSPRAPARENQRRREELIEIACAVFAERGFDGATLQEIADRFGVLKGSLFHYIDNKDDLLFAIIEGVYQGAEEAIWPIAAEDDTALGRLRRLIVAYVVYVAEHQAAVTVWLHDLNALEPARRKSILVYEERDRLRLIDLIAEAQREGGVRADADPRLVAMALLGAMNWVHRWFRPGRLSARQVGEELSRVFLDESAPAPLRPDLVPAAARGRVN